MINTPEPPINPPAELRGERIAIRTMQEHEIPLISEWMQDPEVIQFVDSQPQTLERLRSFFHIMKRFPNYWGASIYTVERDELIGDCYLNVLSGRVHTGIVIGKKEEWGKRYGEDVMRLLIDFSREELPVSHMTLVVADLNIRARRLYERLGFCVANRPLLYGEPPVEEGNARMELPL